MSLVLDVRRGMARRHGAVASSFEQAVGPAHRPDAEPLAPWVDERESLARWRYMDQRLHRLAQDPTRGRVDGMPGGERIAAAKFVHIECGLLSARRW
jgi:hypothetical protein